MILPTRPISNMDLQRLTGSLSYIGQAWEIATQRDHLKQLNPFGLYRNLFLTKTHLPNCHRMVRVPEDPRDRRWVDFFDRPPFSSLTSQAKF